MKTSDYKLCHHENEVELEETVRHALAEGWRIHGSLVSHRGILVQSLIQTDPAEGQMEWVPRKSGPQDQNL